MKVRNIKLKIFVIFIVTILILQYTPKHIIYAESNTLKIDNSNKATVTVKQGQNYKLLNYILMNQHGKEKRKKVDWHWGTEKVDTSVAGTIILDGTIKGYNKKVTLIISIGSVNKLPNNYKKYVYPQNKKGQTYGPNYHDASPNLHPDLLEAVGDNGKKGYVLYSQLMYSPVRNPQEAIAYMKKKNRARKIPLYKSDGVTVIGTFTIGHN